MKINQLILLLIVFLILCTSIYIKKSQEPAANPESPTTSLDYAFDSEKIRRIHINKDGESSFSLVREGADWRIPKLKNTKADSERIDRLMALIQNLEGDMRGNNPNQFEAFAIDDENAIRLQFFGEEKERVFDFYVGFMRAGFRDVFVRAGSSSEVYFVKKNLLSELGIFGNLKGKRPKAEFWASLILFDFDLDLSKRIRLEVREKKKVKTPLDLIKKEDALGWSYANSKKDLSLDSRRVEEYFYTLENIRASKVVDLIEEDYDFEKPDKRLTFELSSGEVIEYAFISEPKKGAYYVKSTIMPIFLEVTSHHVKKAAMKDESFKKILEENEG